MAALDVAIITFIARIVALGQPNNETSTRFQVLLDEFITAVAYHNFTGAQILIPSARNVLSNDCL
jgi:hypothetical protein